MGIWIRHLAWAGIVCVTPAFAQTVVTVTPTTAEVHLGTFQQFTARVTGATSTSVTWTVSLPAGATGSAGSVSTGGRYTPPSVMPSVNSVTVTATSVATPTVSASAVVTLDNFYPTLASTMPVWIPLGPFTLTMNGTGFVPGAQVLFDGVPLSTTYVSATRLTAAGSSTYQQNGQRVPVAVTNPAPGPATSVDAVSVLVGTTDSPRPIPAQVAARFLDQAAHGADAATLAHVQSMGLADYINEQLTAPISPYPDPSQTGFGIGQVQARFFANAVHGQDQLRQRVAFALGQIFVISATEENTPAQLVPYLRILQQDAFANFRKLMYDVTLSPTMGEYLDMRNNDKANPALDTRANENYARELMQLFTIGLFMLNQDGTLQLDANHNPIPTYDQTTIQNFAKIYTGWTYATKAGATPQKHNPVNYGGPMVAFASNHDTSVPKILLNYPVPPGIPAVITVSQTAQKDLDDALNNIFFHPNVAPFVSKQLIQHLVTSNPSPAYVGRIAAVFNNNGNQVRGDLGSVVTAILLDPEARAGDYGPSPTPPDPNGHLREPVFLIASILRGLGAQVNDSNTLTNLATGLGQTLFQPPSVFNYYAPGYQVPSQFTSGVPLLGPEFQLQSPSAAVARVNLVNSIVYGNLGAGAVIDLAPFSKFGNDPTALLNAVSNTYFYGQMPGTIRTAITGALSAITGTTAAAAKARAQAALYLAVSSAYYNVEH